MDEEWRDIPGFEGYQVSNLGKVRSRKNGSGELLESWHLLTLPLDHGYPRATLSKNGKAKHYSVHTLVLLTFVGPRPSGYVARHLDGIRTHSRLDNLEWSTPKVNLNDRIAHGTMLWKEHHHQHKLSQAQVDAIRQEYRRWNWRRSNVRELAQKYGVSRTTIVRIVKRILWS